MVRVIKFFAMNAFFILISFAVFAVFADKTNKVSLVAGDWETIDGKTKKPSAVIRVARVGDIYEGKIVKIYTVTTEKSDDVCKECKGEQQDKPILGLTIISDMQCLADYCKGGMILDPRDGKLYHASMKLVENGQKLRVRGYVGIPLFGKTVIWNRITTI
ncbi:MAG: DUF2147 domain-containing protein [Coxiellaceae bacterium]|nr:DUF2147 domain-containing protein [Coxiellaceae bacterium]